MEVVRLVLVVTAFMDVVICNQMNGRTYSKRARERRSEHFIETVQSFNRSNESSAEVNNEGLRYVTSIWKERGVSVRSAAENSVGNSTQTDRQVSISLEGSTNVVSVFNENSSVESEKQDQKETQNNAGNDKQLLAENSSSLHQYSNSTARSFETQFQHHTLNNKARDTKDIRSEDTARNLSTHYLHNISRNHLQEGNDLSSAETSTSSLPPQSLEHTSLTVKPNELVTPSQLSFHIPNLDAEVLNDSLRNNSNSNEANLPSNVSVPQFFSYLTSTENSTTPFSDLNVNFAKDFKYVTDAANATMQQVPSNSSEHFLKPHTTNFPEGLPILTSITEKLYKATLPPNISFILPATTEKKNEANMSENTPPYQSESSAKSTPSADFHSLFYSVNANTNTTTGSPPMTLAVLYNSTEPIILLGTTTESNNAASADVPQISPVPVLNLDYSTISLGTTVPSSIQSTSISTLKSLETPVSRMPPVVTSVEAITSNAISTTKVSAETTNSSKMSNTEQSAASVTTSSTLNPVTTYKNASSLEGISKSTISSTVPSLENITSREISSTMQFTETKSIISSSLLSSETVSLGLISATVPSLATITSNTISSAMTSTGTVTPSKFSTFFNTVPSVNRQMPTTDNEIQVAVGGKNKSSHNTEEELEKSFSTLDDKSNTTSLNKICEKLFCKSVKMTNTQRKKDPLTIVFKSDMEVAEWFLIWDMSFRKYISKALTQYKGIQEKWNKTFSPEDILYVTPGPFVNGINLTMCILIKVSAQEEENMFLSGKCIQKCLEEITPNLKETLHLDIIDTSIGILTPQHHCRAQERGSNQMTVTIAMIVTTVMFMLIIVAVMLAMKCQQHHRSSEAPSGISYRLPSHSDGRHLATDEECTAMEGRNSHLQEEKSNGSTPSTSKASANVKLISKEEHEKKLNVCFSGTNDSRMMGNCNMEAKEDIVMVQLHKPPAVYYQ